MQEDNTTSLLPSTLQLHLSQKDTSKGVHRFDLQGLRGVAILSVLGFHFFSKWFPNGYVGVDQFFVLSGYLMAMILDTESGFSHICDFYYRRLKRIIPMYILMILLILWSCLFIFPESNLDLNGKSVIPALIFLSNLWRTAGGFVQYFAEFYLVVPILHLFIREYPTRTQMTCLLIVGSVSFAFHVFSDPISSFYHPFARIWQFLAGHLAYLSSSTCGKYASVKTEESTDEREHEEQQYFTDAAIALNTKFTFNELRSLRYDRCDYINESNNRSIEDPYWWCLFKGMNESASNSALIIGNSWAANNARVIHEGCRNHLRTMTLFSYAACEVLVHTHTYHSCNSAHRRYDKIIRKMRPDYLFVISRHVMLLPRLKQTTDIYSLCLDKQVFSRIQRIQKPVKKKVFILDVLPRTMPGYLNTLNSKLLKHEPVNQTEFIEPTEFEFARSILRRAVSSCEKCSLISYDRIFGTGKSFQVFDPLSKVAYFTNGIHISAAGLWKIAPVYERLCGSF